MTRRRPGRLRIIGGHWRSRLIDFVDDGRVRPTPDRVRQTLFDWLSPVIEGARCLDLFAGSGALGLEALSRGAAHVTLVEREAAQVSAIAEAVRRLTASDRAEVLRVDAIDWLQRAGSGFDIVFLDPPYESPLLEQALVRLPRLLTPAGRVYLEWLHGQVPPLPAGFRLIREKRAGRVSYGLMSRSEETGS